MDAATAAIIAAAIGGLTGILSSTIPLILTGRTLTKQLDADMRKAKMSILLNKRQIALETLWLTLTADLRHISDNDRRSYISATLWAPTQLRTLCLEALAQKDNNNLTKDAQSELIRHINSMEYLDEPQYR